MPTFGEKWEIDRNKMSLGNILGRGNYGIVYQALLEQENEDGKFFDIPVAVKTVKGQQLIFFDHDTSRTV